MYLTQDDLLKNGSCLCFDDILLTPNYSNLESRTSPCLATKLGNRFLSLPVVSSPMDSITQSKMLMEMDSAGGLGILTRFINDDNESSKQVAAIKEAKKENSNIGCAIGIRGNVIDKVDRLLDVGCNFICLDVAHAHHSKMRETIESLVEHRYVDASRHFSIIAGNVCTKDAASALERWGADIIKVGIGPGAACTTRRVTGFGVPQLTAIISCKQGVEKAAIIADGGIRNTGHMVKALWAGADACMVGYMLAGTSATPDIGHVKTYRGMSSRTVHNRSDVAPEGIDITMQYQGETSIKLKEFEQGIKAGLAMGGCENLEQLRKNVKCVRVTAMTIKENDPLG